MRRHALIAALVLAATPVAGLAQDRTPPGPAEAARESGPLVPLPRVLAMIAKRHPGRQLDTTMGEAGGRPTYLIRWQLTKGQIVVFTVDARTGQMMG
jgi:uncharacterized membrane protein YkoI